MSSRYTCAVAGVRTASLFEAAQYSTAQMDENSCVRHPSRDTWVPPSFNCCEHEVQVGLPEILLWVLLDLEWDAQWVCHARPQGRPHDTVLGSPASSCRSGTPPFPLRRQMHALEGSRSSTWLDCRLRPHPGQALLTHPFLLCRRPPSHSPATAQTSSYWAV